MAIQMFRVSKKDLEELIKKIPDDEYIGYIMTVQNGDMAQANQSLMLYKPLTDNLI